MPCEATALANALLDIAAARGEALTNLKLQKLVYFAQGWALAARGRPLVNEQAEAWPLGPVFPTVYHAFRDFGAAPIDARAPVAAAVEPGTRAFLESVYAVYGAMSAEQLSRLSHVPGGPWDRTWRASAGMRGTDIPLNAIRDYFRRLQAAA